MYACRMYVSAGPSGATWACGGVVKLLLLLLLSPPSPLIT